MNQRYQQLKKEYDEIGEQILSLHAKQQDLQRLMEEACTHERLIRVESDPFDLDEGFEEEESYKCRDCYRYFTRKERDEMVSEKKKSNQKDSDCD